MDCSFQALVDWKMAMLRSYWSFICSFISVVLRLKKKVRIADITVPLITPEASSRTNSSTEHPHDAGKTPWPIAHSHSWHYALGSHSADSDEVAMKQVVG
jgi:hypothetical protein